MTRFFINKPVDRAYESVQKNMEDELAWQAENQGRRVLRFTPLTFTETNGGNYVGKLTAFVSKRR